MIKAFGMPLHTRQTQHECQNRAFYGTSMHNCAAPLEPLTHDSCTLPRPSHSGHAKYQWMRPKNALADHLAAVKSHLLRP